MCLSGIPVPSGSISAVYTGVSVDADAVSADLVSASPLPVPKMARIKWNIDFIFWHCFWNGAYFNMAVLETSEAFFAEFPILPAGIYGIMCQSGRPGLQML